MDVPSIRKIVETPEEAVATVVLLDQLPRNMFREDKAIKAGLTLAHPRGSLIEIIRRIEIMIRRP